MTTKVFKITDPSDPSVREAARILKNGGLVAFPTDTVYGLGALSTISAATERIFEVKGRPYEKALILLLSSPADIEMCCGDIPDKAYELAERFWPGPLTLVLPKRRDFNFAVAYGMSTVAVRCPDNAIARELIRLAGAPVAAPSANTSGKPSPRNADDVLADLGGRIDAVIDGGECIIGRESTILDLTANTPRIIRQGALSPEVLM
ncbi:MAG: L-threonylcarbamoyladenylate synthase [Oscillospiraceae bacterium]|jgi:L-threonylcarbamoyladenylate synthase